MLFKKRQPSNSPRQVIAQTSPKSVSAEQYRTLRTNIQFSGIDKKITSLLITSPDLGAGKSFIAANLAAVYAQQGIKTLLIDGDMRRPTVHYTFKLSNLTGLSSALVEDVPLINMTHQSVLDQLDIMTSGPIPPNPAELLGSSRFQNRLTEVAKTYEMIIVDSPPLLAVTDAGILASLLDAVLLVVRSEQTELDELKESVKLIKKTKGNLIGTVLNDLEVGARDNYYYSE